MIVRKVVTINIQVQDQNFENTDQKVNYQVQEIPEINAYLEEGFNIERMFHTPPSNSGDCLNLTFVLSKKEGDSEQKRKMKMKL
ncbi:hypothetical protein BKI52_03825 [marine bacterium AO1-C]|nr:hypothetical protein BKI52_03825 [marine bacterium AO1-C]